MKSLFKFSPLFLFTLFATQSFAANTQPIKEQQLARDIYQQFIESPSIFDTGSTKPIIDATVKRLKEAGFSDKDIFVGGAKPTKANLVVRLRGTGQEKPMLLLAHIDVVDAKKSDWSMDPFKFTEKDGYFYGRGTTDNKAEAAVWIANLIQYKREGFVPNRDIIVALTADEEGLSPDNGVAWLLQHHKNLIDADFALNEGGGPRMRQGKKSENTIQVSEKYMLNYRLEVRNSGGHSSLPTSNNAIYHLAAALDHLSHYQFPLKTNLITSAYFAKMAQQENGETKNLMLNASKNDTSAMETLADSSALWNAKLRTTCIPTMLEGGHALNALPQLAVANINCRAFSDESPESIEQTLTQVIADPLVKVSRIGPAQKSPDSELRPDIVNAVTKITEEMWPNVPTVPVMLTGATDGRFLRAHGIPTYGVDGFYIDSDDIRMHGRDERMSVQSFYEGQAFLYKLVKELST